MYFSVGDGMHTFVIWAPTYGHGSCISICCYKYFLLRYNTASPLPYANSPRSGTNTMNAPSPRQESQQKHQQLQQQRRKLMQLPQHQQLLAQQQYRRSSL